MVVSFLVPVSSCFDTLLTLKGIVGLFQIILKVLAHTDSMLLLLITWQT